MTAEDKSQYVYVDKVIIIKPVWSRHKTTDTRRKLLGVEFNNGTIWWPKDDELQHIQETKAIVHKHNLKFKDLDKEGKK